MDMTQSLFNAGLLRNGAGEFIDAAATAAPATLPLVLFHGLLSTPQEFGLMAHALRSHGIVHHAPTLPGYTLAGAGASGWHGWRNAAHDAIDAACPGDGAVVLGGLCMGGMLAAATALGARRRIAGLVLMSPTFRYDGWGMSPVRHLRHLGYWTGIDRFFSVRERQPYGVKNPRIRQWIMRELQASAVSAAGPARIPLTALRQAEHMMAHVRGGLAALRCPLLLIHAREDEITSIASVQKVFDALPTTDKQLAILENSYHMITIDNDRQQVSRLLQDFVKRLAQSAVAHPTGTP